MVPVSSVPIFLIHVLGESKLDVTQCGRVLGWDVRKGTKGLMKWDVQECTQGLLAGQKKFIDH